ncbi:MAG: hypothetical protein K9W44_16295 [Candidatus Lokiarchaeota archaeon]|nr:hypothetical protein [Candidatus Harpocratesius repetitus]
METCEMIRNAVIKDFQERRKKIAEIMNIKLPVFQKENRETEKIRNWFRENYNLNFQFEDFEQLYTIRINKEMGIETRYVKGIQIEINHRCLISEIEIYLIIGLFQKKYIEKIYTNFKKYQDLVKRNSYISNRLKQIEDKLWKYVDNDRYWVISNKKFEKIIGFADDLCILYADGIVEYYDNEIQNINQLITLHFPEYFKHKR